jgi:hypothetical protein
MLGVIGFPGIGAERCLTRKTPRRVLRYALTGIRFLIKGLAQRGPDEALERLREKRGGGRIVYDGILFQNLNDVPDPDNLTPEECVTKQILEKFVSEY